MLKYTLNNYKSDNGIPTNPSNRAIRFTIAT